MYYLPRALRRSQSLQGCSDSLWTYFRKVTFIRKFSKRKIGQNEYDQKTVNEINDKIMIEIDSAFKFAKNDKFPNPASIKKFVYA